MWLLYGIIIILSALVYNLGFARKLSIIKKYSDIYIVSDWMYSFNFLCGFLPVGEGLVVAAIVLGIYRLRLHQARQQKAG
ncbi:YlaH-like family protein [Bacillus sanguinis]